MSDPEHRLYLLAGAVVFVLGYYSLLVRAHFLRRIMALNIMGGGVFLVYIAIGSRGLESATDPVPQAMVLTGIVVSVCATGLALALADRVQAAMGPSSGRTDDDSGDGEDGTGESSAQDHAQREGVDRE